MTREAHRRRIIDREAFVRGFRFILDINLVAWGVVFWLSAFGLSIKGIIAWIAP